ncbi:unnamed protein product, partial [Rotaria magnacalcarata]
MFLILSDQYEENIISKIHNLQQLNSIFIFDHNQTSSELWVKEYSKVRGVYNNFELLKIDLTNAVENFLKCERMIPELFNTNNKAFTMNILRNDLWLIRLLYVLIHQKPPANSKEDFVHMFSLYYKALRQRNIPIICAYHFFIYDLYQHIERAHQLFNKTTSSMHVYRRQIMNKMEIERIKDSNKFDLRLSNSSMLSTSLDHTAASVFIEGYKPNDDYHGVLFEIECNTNLISRPFAEVSKKSYFPDEQEVLFMPGGAFAVNDIQLDQSNQLYVIKLRLCNDQEIQKGFYKKNIFKGDRDAVRELFSDMGTSTIVHECSDLDQLY